LAFFIQCSGEKASDMSKTEAKVKIQKMPYGIMADGRTVDQFVLENSQGMRVSIITFGGIITEWTAPNKSGIYENVVFHYDSLSQYEAGSPYFGALIGRYGNRIAKGKFSLDGNEYSLAVNNDPNHLHGGLKGFDKVLWTPSTSETDTTVSLELTYLSKDGEEGYPGNLNTTVVYTLTNGNELAVKYKATTDKKTVVNLTQHSYFNLTADFSKKILDHEIMLDAPYYLPVDDGLIPTGELRSVEGTPFDFREPKAIGLEIGSENEQLRIGKGYDHCWVFKEMDGIRKVASAYEANSGRLLEVFTTEPAIQFYTGNFLDGTLPMPQGGTYQHRTGFCLETEHYPDSPNQSEFPSTVLEPGDIYESETRFRFSVK
jgi:aldose 1-epimerase